MTLGWPAPVAAAEVRAAAPVALPLTLGARTLWRFRRRLHRVAIGLDGALAHRPPALPPLGDAEGWLVTSLPAAHLAALPGGHLALVRQRYARRWADLTIGFDAWLAGMSGNARSALRRKVKKLADAEGGRIDVRACHDAGSIDAFHLAARAL